MTVPAASASPSPFAVIREALAFIGSPRAIRPGAGPSLATVFGDAAASPPAPPPIRETRPLLVLLGLNLVVLFSLLPLLELWNGSVGIETPKLVLDDNASSLLLVAVVAVLPLLEEIVFRGWLTGKPWQLLAVGLAIAGFAGAVLVNSLGVPHGGPVVLAVTVIAVIAGAFAIRKRQQAPGWFVRHFRWIFWITALLFAAAHYTNYQGVTLAHAPLVLPQLWSGLLLGFVRLRFGITRSMALHMASNGLVVAISALTGAAGA